MKVIGPDDGFYYEFPVWVFAHRGRVVSHGFLEALPNAETVQGDPYQAVFTHRDNADELADTLNDPEIVPVQISTGELLTAIILFKESSGVAHVVYDPTPRVEREIVLYSAPEAIAHALAASRVRPSGP